MIIGLHTPVRIISGNKIELTGSVQLGLITYCTGRSRYRAVLQSRVVLYRSMYLSVEVTSPTVTYNNKSMGKVKVASTSNIWYLLFLPGAVKLSLEITTIYERSSTCSVSLYTTHSYQYKHTFDTHMYGRHSLMTCNVKNKWERCQVYQL